MKHLTTFWRKVATTFLVTTFALAFFSCDKEKDGAGSGLDIEGIDGPHIVIEDGFLSIDVTFENLDLVGGLRYPIPEYPQSYVEIGPAFETDGSLLSIHIAIGDLGGTHLADLDPQTLPGGRPLPGVRSGRLPAVAFNIEEFHNIHIYAGNNFLGAFLPIPSLDIQQAILTARFHLDNGKKAGNISLVGQDEAGENAGILLLLNLKADLFKSSNVQHFFPNLLDEASEEVTCNPSDDDSDCNSNDA